MSELITNWESIITGPTEKQIGFLEKMHINPKTVKDINEARVAIQTNLGANKVNQMRTVKINLPDIDDASIEVDEVGTVTLVLRQFIKTKSGKISQIISSHLDYSDLRRTIRCAIKAATTTSASGSLPEGTQTHPEQK